MINGKLIVYPLNIWSPGYKNYKIAFKSLLKYQALSVNN